MIVDNTIIFGQSTLIIGAYCSRRILRIRSVDTPIPDMLRPSDRNLEKVGIKVLSEIEISLDKIIYIKLLDRKILNMIKNRKYTFEYAGYIWDFSKCKNNNALNIIKDGTKRIIFALLREERKRHENIKEKYQQSCQPGME